MVSATEVLFASSDLAHRVLAHLSPGDLPVDVEPDSAIAQEWMEDARTLARLACVNHVVSKIALDILWRQTEIQLLLCVFPTYNSETLVSPIIDKLLPNVLFRSLIHIPDVRRCYPRSTLDEVSRICRTHTNPRPRRHRHNSHHRVDCANAMVPPSPFSPVYNAYREWLSTRTVFATPCSSPRRFRTFHSRSPKMPTSVHWAW